MRETNPLIDKHSFIEKHTGNSCLVLKEIFHPKGSMNLPSKQGSLNGPENQKLRFREYTQVFFWQYGYNPLADMTTDLS